MRLGNLSVTRLRWFNVLDSKSYSTVQGSSFMDYSVDRLFD
ncbi:unnamed protein product [Acidithrix sp. C25]|nr:unnamed protein product [Acidithrix sp. C25]